MATYTQLLLTHVNIAPLTTRKGVTPNSISVSLQSCTNPIVKPEKNVLIY